MTSGIFGERIERNVHFITPYRQSCGKNNLKWSHKSMILNWVMRVNADENAGCFVIGVARSSMTSVHVIDEEESSGSISKERYQQFIVGVFRVDSGFLNMYQRLLQPLVPVPYKNRRLLLLSVREKRQLENDCRIDCSLLLATEERSFNSRCFCYKPAWNKIPAMTCFIKSTLLSWRLRSVNSNDEIIMFLSHARGWKWIQTNGKNLVSSFHSHFCYLN